MFWSYCIVKTKDGYGLYEVYFENTWSKPFTRTVEPIYFGENVDEVKEAIKMMISDVNKNPILNDEDIKEENGSYN